GIRRSRWRNRRDGPARSCCPGNGRIAIQLECSALRLLAGLVNEAAVHAQRAVNKMTADLPCARSSAGDDRIDMVANSSAGQIKRAKVLHVCRADDQAIGVLV